MPNRKLEEKNIDRLLAHFQQQDQYQTIREWRQRIENKEARLAHRSTKTINVEQAVQDFRRVLLSDTEHSESSKHLLRKFNQPAQPKFTAVEAWRLQNPANRPATLTPEQQGYVDQYDQLQRDRAKWDMPIPENRLLEWDELDAQGLKEAVWADQAKIFEEWLDQHPAQTKELIARFIKPGAHPDETSLPNSYHWSGLYWIAANVVFKRFGVGDDLRDEVAGAVLDRFKYFWKELSLSPIVLDPKRREALETAGGEAYVETHKRLSRHGAHTIQQLENYLVRSMQKILKGERALDPEQRKRERRRKKEQIAAEDETLGVIQEEEIGPSGFEIDEVDTLHHDSSPMSPERAFIQLPSSINEEDDAPTSEARANENPMSTAELAEFVRTLSDQQKDVFVPLLQDPTLTNKDLALRRGCTPRRIAQIRDDILRLWNSR